MVTATRSETTKIVKRAYLLQWQVRNLLSRTTAESQDWLEKIDKGIQNQWFRSVKVHGFDDTNRCHCGVELEINWLRYTIEVAVWGEEVRINQTVFAHEEVAPEVVNAIEVFNQIVNAECLRTEWRCQCVQGVDVDMVCRELGMKRAPAITWAGKVITQSFQVAEMPELTVRLLIAESTDLVPLSFTKQESLASLVARLREHVGETPAMTSTQAAELGRLMRVFVGMPPEEHQPSPKMESLFERLKQVVGGGS